MTFWLKKIVTLGLMPLPLAIGLLIVALWLMGRPRFARLGRVVAVTALGFLMLMSNYYVARSLLRPLETRHPSVPELQDGERPSPQLAACRLVVVLGAGEGYGPGMAANNQLAFSALARITEGARVLRMLPEARLVVCGPELGDGVTHASQLAQAAQSLGVAADRITRLERARDTEEEARLIRDLAGTQPVALVTSAAHMSRALALLRGTGITAVPCPTGYRTQEHEVFMPARFFVDPGSLQDSTNAWHEYLGLLWSWLRGRT